MQSTPPQYWAQGLTLRAEDTESPTMPLSSESRVITARSTAKKTTRLPTKSKRMASHLHGVGLGRG